MWQCSFGQLVSFACDILCEPLVQSMAPPREKPSEASLQFAEGRCQQSVSNPNVADRETLGGNHETKQRENTFFFLLEQPTLEDHQRP